MAEYTCCSSVAFERPIENTFTFTLHSAVPLRPCAALQVSKEEAREAARRKAELLARYGGGGDAGARNGGGSGGTGRGILQAGDVDEEEVLRLG
jgi:hypothetical protein